MLTTTLTPITTTEPQTAQTKSTSIIPLLQQAGFDSVKADTAQQISKFIIEQRINAGRESKDTEAKVDFGEIVQKPISLKEITTHTEAISNIINPPKQEPSRKTGFNLANAPC
jgi:hypothetical protein